jgi:lipopolysaccharide transport system ATP-binding protein
VPIVGLVIRNDKGVVVHGKSTLEYGTRVPQAVTAGMRLRCRQAIELQLAVGEYTFQVGLASIHAEDYDKAWRTEHSLLTSATHRVCQVIPAGDFTILLRAPVEPVQLLHHGIANLPGHCRVTLVESASAIGSEEPVSLSSS